MAAMFTGLFPPIPERLRKFGFSEGMAVVDCGCEPGGQPTRSAARPGEPGEVRTTARDGQAIQALRRRIGQFGLTSEEPVLATGD